MQARSRIGPTLVVASHNSGKLREIARLAAPYDIALRGAQELGLDDVAETGAGFADNARLKAHAACRQSGLPALADDSGYCVAALDGAPGIYSARWAGPNRDFDQAMRAVHDALTARLPGNVLPSEDGQAPRAHFVCVLCLALPGGAGQLFRGEIHGRFVWPPRGNRGFGYDPVFRAEGDSRSFGEITAEEKHFGSAAKAGFSHRARAFEKFAAQCLMRK